MSQEIWTYSIFWLAFPDQKSFVDAGRKTVDSTSVFQRKNEDGILVISSLTLVMQNSFDVGDESVNGHMTCDGLERNWKKYEFLSV